MAMPRFDGGTSLTTSPSIFSSPRGDLLQPGDHAQQRRLAAARRTDEDDEFARFDVEVDAVENVEAAVGFLDCLEREIGHDFLPVILLDDSGDAPEPGAAAAELGSSRSLACPESRGPASGCSALGRRGRPSAGWRRG